MVEENIGEKYGERWCNLMLMLSWYSPAFLFRFIDKLGSLMR